VIECGLSETRCVVYLCAVVVTGGVGVGVAHRQDLDFGRHVLEHLAAEVEVPLPLEHHTPRLDAIAITLQGQATTRQTARSERGKDLCCAEQAMGAKGVSPRYARIGIFQCVPSHV
jgi:hypothetical protein